MKFQLSLGQTLGQKVKKKIEKYEFEVGILEDAPHKDPVESSHVEVATGQANLKTYAGGPVRPTSRKAGPNTIGEIFIANEERLNVDLLRKPLQDENSDINKFARYFLKLAFGHPGVDPKRIENLLQAIVRNPILKLEYGKNKASTADAKGFDRNLFDTGQMFKAIKAKVIRKG